MTSWEGSPESKIHKYDVSIAKNYLTEDELKILTRIVTAYLDFAESMALRNIPMTMKDWEIRLDGFLTLMDHDVLKDKGRISAEEAKLHAETEFEKYRIIQDRLFVSDFDKFLELEDSVKDIDEKVLVVIFTIYEKQVIEEIEKINPTARDVVKILLLYLTMRRMVDHIKLFEHLITDLEIYSTGYLIKNMK